jgi:hypothetical protein
VSPAGLVASADRGALLTVIPLATFVGRRVIAAMAGTSAPDRPPFVTSKSM